MEITTKELNNAALVSVESAQSAALNAVVSMIQSLLMTRPTSEVRLARISATLQLLQAVGSMHALLTVVMNQGRTAEDVEDLAEQADVEINKVETKVAKYVELLKVGTDIAFEEPEQMSKHWGREGESQRLNEKLQATAEAYAKALEFAEQSGGSVGEIFGNVISIEPGLTKGEKLVS